MKFFFSILLFLTSLCAIGQIEHDLVVAESGDGIFSMLRKQGLNPAKYYAEFVELNKHNLRNGSELHLGRAYLIPYAKDSFKKTGIEVITTNKEESPIFKTELAQLSPKSEKLKNAVIYLISGNSLNHTSVATQKVSHEITLSLAQELMVHGAQVFIIKSDAKAAKKVHKNNGKNSTEGAMADISQMGEYVGIINKKYLKHQGKYQRLLITRVNSAITKEHCDVAVYHHSASENGKRIAANIQRTFNANSVKSKPIKDYTEIFTDKNNLFLAKNALPAVTLVDINSKQKPTIKDYILVDSNKEKLSNLIANGVLNDYADIELEE